MIAQIVISNIKIPFLSFHSAIVWSKESCRSWRMLFSWSEWVYNLVVCNWASTAVSSGVHVVLAACTLFRPSTYICLFKYTILYWSFPVGICIQWDVTQYNCNYYNRAVFTWLSKGIGFGFGFGFGFTTPFDWLVYLLWFWFYDSQVKTALLLYIAGDGTS